MGARASYIIITENNQEYFYHHWGAPKILSNIFWGPKSSDTYIRALSPSDGILDDAFCEGAVSMNLLKKELLFFAISEDIISNNLKRIYLALLKLIWDGWSVRWAKNELYTIIHQLGLPQDDYINSDPYMDFDLSMEDIRISKTWRPQTVITIKSNEELRHYVSGFSAIILLYQGAKMFDMIASFEQNEIKPETVLNQYLSHLFIDLADKQIYHCCESERHYSFHKVLDEKWPDWTLIEHNQGMYKHSLLCGLDWEEFVLKEEKAIRYLESSLFVPSKGEKKNVFNNVVHSWEKMENHYSDCLEAQIW